MSGRIIEMESARQLRVSGTIPDDNNNIKYYYISLYSNNNIMIYHYNRYDLLGCAVLFGLNIIIRLPIFILISYIGRYVQDDRFNGVIFVTFLKIFLLHYANIISRYDNREKK